MKRTVSMISMVAAISLMAAGLQAGPKVEFGEEGWLKFLLLGQMHYSHMDDADQQDDFYLRRGRLIFVGQVRDGVKVFMETDNDKAGMRGKSVSTDVQDAFVDLRILDADNAKAWLKCGMILLPFSFESTSSAASLLGLDYNAEAIKLANTFVWRDMGAELHGNVGRRLAYRVGVFDGYDTTGDSKSDKAALRVTGHVAVNLLGKVETGWFASQSRFIKGDGAYLSIGAGFDQQDRANSIMGEVDGASVEVSQQDSQAAVIDIQSGFPFSDSCAVLFNGGYYDWDSTVFKGSTVTAEAGLLMNKAMITAKYSSQDADGTAPVDNYTAGVHYFISGHGARCGLEYRSGDSSDSWLAGVQFLL